MWLTAIRNMNEVSHIWTSMNIPGFSTIWTIEADFMTILLSEFIAELLRVWFSLNVFSVSRVYDMFIEENGIQNGLRAWIKQAWLTFSSLQPHRCIRGRVSLWFRAWPSIQRVKSPEDRTIERRPRHERAERPFTAALTTRGSLHTLNEGSRFLHFSFKRLKSSWWVHMN